ncbi:MAG: hypothetical protein HC881_24245 [Leptolyngbyaceae cyanobacterium SL_7_1]|nr:hypothetical protein [Leptolyngbyaceae cyanobacterium SL_7_1]
MESIIMAEEFLDAPHPSNEGAIEERERVQVLIISSRDGVTETIQTLHHRGFADVNDWSPLLPAPTSGEVMSILRRDRLVRRSVE